MWEAARKVLHVAAFLSLCVTIVWTTKLHRFEEVRWQIIFLGLVILGCDLLVVYLNRRRARSENHPVVYLCETSGMKTLCPEEYFDLALERKRIIDRADVLSDRQPTESLVAPDAMLFFPLTIAQELAMGLCKAGGGKEFEAIALDCRVVRCLMYIPQTQHAVQSHRVHPISLDAGWQIIHNRLPAFTEKL